MAGSTPIYGFPYPESSDLVANYPALGQDLAEDIEATIAAIPPGGLAHIATESFSAVSSVALDGVFTSTYRDYKILMELTAVSTTDINVSMKLRASTTAATTNYVSQGWYVYGTASGARYNTTGTDEWFYMTVDSGYPPSFGSLDLIKPQIAAASGFIGTSIGAGGGANSYANFMTGKHTTATAYDGIQFQTSTGTMTGTIRVYGYANS